MGDSNSSGTAHSLTLQSVLFENDPDAIARSITAMSVSASLAAEGGLVSEWEVNLGDCSNRAVLDAVAIATLQDRVRGFGGSFSATHFGANLGHGGAHNALSQHAGGDVLAFVNPDGILDPACIRNLAGALSDGVGIVDGRQLPLEHPKEYDAVTGETEWTSGAVMAIRKRDFLDLGGFDSDSFFLYGDDVDLSWRVRLSGQKAVHVPSARMFHDKRLTLVGSYEASETELYYSAEAALLLAAKYSRPDVLKSTIALYRSERKPHVLKAVAEYERRASENLLPTPLDAQHTVATFNVGYYTTHRF